MLRRCTQAYAIRYGQFSVNSAVCYLNVTEGLSSTTARVGTEHVELPPTRLQRSERKPLVISINELKRKARLQRKRRQEVSEIVLEPPENGLLVKSLIPVAHEVYSLRKELYECVSLILKSFPVHVCRSCEEVYVGKFLHQIRTCDVAGSLPSKEHRWIPGGVEHMLPIVDSFHLYDRLGRAVSHEERLQVDRIPAIVELCVQAGVDIMEYPTKRRTYPVYSIAGKLIDFERKFPRDYSSGKDIETHGFWLRKESKPGRPPCFSVTDDLQGKLIDFERKFPRDYSSGKDIETHGFWLRKESKPGRPPCFSVTDDLQGIAQRGLNAWEKLRSGAVKLMQKYAVQTCGYCSEVQVGPKGHRARICQAYKHQMRDGQHAWQKATVDDLIPPVYVWHVPRTHNGCGFLVHELRRYYGKLPAVVELFAQAGACLGEGYHGLMRADVAIPELDEVKFVV